jgi:hypothetical protein
VASARPLYTLMVSLSNHEPIGGLVLRQAQDERVQKRQAQETSRTARAARRLQSIAMRTSGSTRQEGTLAIVKPFRSQPA